MSMFGPKEGTWGIHCKSDRRWDGSGRTKWLVTAGMPPEAKAHLESKEKELGIKPPEDTEYSFWKD